MTGYVVDASVVMKRLVTEDYSDEAAELWIGGATLVAPALVLAEAANALWAMRQRRDITGADVADAVDTLHSAPISLAVPMLRLNTAAARLASDLGHPAYDCFYLALAIQAQYPVVTADRRFHDRVRVHPYLADKIVHVAQAAAGDAIAREGGPS